MNRMSFPRRFLLNCALAALAAALQLGCVTIGNCEHPLFHKCKKECPVEPPAVTVTGLVKHPGKFVIPPGGLMLGDAVALAGGDLPEQFFPGVNPAKVLVSLERPSKIYHFSLPLVTKDLAGKIFLVAGDKVSLQPAATTDLGRSALRGATEDYEAWRAIVKRPDVGQTPLEYDVPFADANERERIITVTIPATLQTDGIPSGRAAPAPGSTPTSTTAPSAPPPPPLKVLIADPNLPAAADLRAADTAPFEANLLRFSERSVNAQESTVMVLDRRLPGKQHQFVLLRPASIATGADSTTAAEVLRSITVIPGDAVATNTMLLLPPVLTSLAIPKLYDPTPRPQVCLPRLQNRKQELAQTLLPLTTRIDSLKQRLCPPVEVKPNTVKKDCLHP